MLGFGFGFQTEFTQKIGELFGFELPDYAAHQTLDWMVRSARSAKRNPLVFTKARQLTDHCGNNEAAKMAVIFNYARDRISFQHDPMMLYKGEWVQSDVIKTPERILREIFNWGHTTEDCDGYAILEAALLHSVGCKAGYWAVCTKHGQMSGRLDHVFCVGKDRATGKVVNLDASTPMKHDWSGHRRMEVWL